MRGSKISSYLFCVRTRKEKCMVRQTKEVFLQRFPGQVACKQTSFETRGEKALQKGDKKSLVIPERHFRGHSGKWDIGGCGRAQMGDRISSDICGMIK